MTRLVNSGFLFKAPPKNEKFKTKFAVQWRCRMFKLWSNKEFYYYEDFSCNKMKGEIPLNKVDITDLKYPLALPKHPWVISINVREENREYLLAAADEQSLFGWGAALESVLKIDYIKASDVASSNNKMLEIRCNKSDESRSYLPILTERDRIHSYHSSPANSIEPTHSIGQVKLSTNSDEAGPNPYEIYDPKSESLASDEDVYMPMDPHALDADDNSPSEDDRPDTLNLTDPEINPEEQPIIDSRYVVLDLNNELDAIKTEEVQPKISASTDIYEPMSPTIRTEDTLDGSEDAQDPIPETNTNRYDHLDDYTEMLQTQLQKVQEDRRNNMTAQSESTTDYEDVENVKLINTEDAIDDITNRQGRAYTTHAVDIVEDEPPERPIRPRKGSGLGILEELRKGEVGKFQNLLENYWVMHIYLPNRVVVKELVNLEAPVEILIEKLARLFGQESNLHIFSLYVLSDIHQTYDVIRKTDKEIGKGERRLNNDMSFIEQGVTTAKFLQIVSIKEIDKMLYEEYLREKTVMKLTQEFCETWVPFVKGYFSIPDLREVATLSGYIHFVYQTIYDLKSISPEIFLPRNAREINECIKKAREQSLQLKGTSIKDACTTFLNRIVIWPTANTIAFPIRKVERNSIVKKYIEILIVFAKEHIGIVKAEKNLDYGNFMYWWHKNDISTFEIIEKKEMLVIKLTKPIEEANCEFHIKSSMNKILIQMLENFKSSKKKVAKHSSMGNITLATTRKPHSDLFVKNPLDDNDY